MVRFHTVTGRVSCWRVSALPPRSGRVSGEVSPVLPGPSLYVAQCSGPQKPSSTRHRLERAVLIHTTQVQHSLQGPATSGLNPGACLIPYTRGAFLSIYLAISRAISFHHCRFPWPLLSYGQHRSVITVSFSPFRLLPFGHVRHVRHRLVPAGVPAVGVAHGDPRRERRRQVIPGGRAWHIARHVIRWRLTQETTAQNELDDIASNICQALRFKMSWMT